MNKYDLAALIALNGLDNGESHKISDKKQAEMFGFVAIKNRVRFSSNNQGLAFIERYSHAKQYTYEELAQSINERKPVESW